MSTAEIFCPKCNRMDPRLVLLFEKLAPQHQAVKAE
jgi:hypothetical protein